MTLYNEHSLIGNTLDTIAGYTNHECDIYVCLSGPRFVEKNLETLQKIKNKEKNYNLFIHANPSGINNTPSQIGAPIYHKFFNMDYDICVAGSPDYVLTEKNAFDLFINRSLNFLENKYMISGVEFDGSGVRFAFCIFTRKVFDEVGYIDPNFIPSGKSDNDYHRRCLLTYTPNQKPEYYNDPGNWNTPLYGESIVIPSCHISYSEHAALGLDYTNFLLKNSWDWLNSKYYFRKWGGYPGTEPGQGGSEKYLIPFNDPDVSLKITYEQVKNGYSKYDRDDQEFCSIL